MSGLDKARETADKIKAENAKVEEKAVEARKSAENQLAAMRENPELAALYKENAKVGSENIGGSAPYLRIHTATSTANELPDGKYPKDGNFFYAPTKEQYDEVFCHILTVSKGFKVWQEDKKTGEKKLQYNQIIGGVIADIVTGEYKPFLMYINGLKCQPLWKFGKAASEFTRQGVPMFALTVKLTTEQVKTEFGMKWVPVFEIVKEENGFPMIVLDIEEFKMLKKGVVTLEEQISGLIGANASGDAPVSITEIDGERVDEIPFS